MPNPSQTPAVEPLSEEALAEIEAALLLHVEGKAMVRVDHARALCQSLRAACARYDAEETDHRLTIDTFRQQERKDRNEVRLPMNPKPVEQRGLVLISALINFADWLDSEGLLTRLPETERAQLVLQFFNAHQKGSNYFMQAEQIAEILGKPFEDGEIK